MPSAWFQPPIHNAAPRSPHGVRKGRSPTSTNSGLNHTASNSMLRGCARSHVQVRIAGAGQPWGEGILRSAGIAADVLGFDEAFEQVQRDRELATTRELEE